MNIKGFDKNLCCRGMQFEIGKTYDTGAKDDEIELCTNTVFHYCKTMQNVHIYYNCGRDNRFCEIEILGAEITDGTKCGSNKIKIIREITGYELDMLCGKTNGNTGLFNTGHSNTGNRNTGVFNTGNWNTGNRNTGNWNTGNWNTGDGNTGDWNKSSFNTGCFMTEEQNIMMFNKPTSWTYEMWYNSKANFILSHIPRDVVEWIYSEVMTDEEKTAHPEHETTGGYLKVLDESECGQIWWGGLSDRNKEVIKSMPNFDADIFYQCTGIKIDG